MDDRRVGRAIRMLRLRRGMRQVDLARRAGVSQSTISLIELGRFDAMSTATIRTVAETVGAEITLDLRWRGAGIDRLLDQQHADLVAAALARLTGMGWIAKPEVSYSVYGERGAIDILAWHAPTGTLLVVEAKTAIGSLEETLRRHDAKTRLAPRIAADQCGWTAGRAARLLVLPARSTPRRQIARADGVLATAYPVRGARLRLWLRQPVDPVAGLLFLSPTSESGSSTAARADRRVRVVDWSALAPDPGSPTVPAGR